LEERAIKNMLQQTIKTDMVAAMKAKEALKVETLRGLMAAFTNELVSAKKKPDEPVTDDMAVAVIRREVKKRKEATEAFKGGNRPELAKKEEDERVILEAYLPATMSRGDIKKVAEAKKVELGVTDKKEAGKLMGMGMKELAGRADGGDVKVVVDSLFV
ncbi:GatB/YqeY domain-containing protein, partial [Candidatus Kaiserbacteria bacterium]|nr:GatB/YqeY domain-containing protein [Candidatus Kaiserbacteria bacterium]